MLQRLPPAASLRPQRGHVTSRPLLPGSSRQHGRNCCTAAQAPPFLASNASQDDSTSKASNPGQQENEQQQELEPTTTPFPPPLDQQQGSAKTTNLADGPVRRTPRGGGGDTPPEPPGPPPLPPQLQRLLLLLTEFGGIYGTVAVCVAWFTHTDPFGGLHWDTNHVLYGIQTFLPIIALDALLMLPDYSIGPEDSPEVAGMFFGDPDALRNWDGSVQVTPGAADTAQGTSGTARDTSAAAGASSSTSSSNSSSKPAENPVLRIRMALQLLQQVYTRANPGAGLSPLAELGVVCVACLADEMLYRAVGLTLVGLWLRDRLYEAGFDETVTLSLFSASKELPTPEFARYAAVALIASLGIAGFAAGALREIESIKKLQVLDKDGSASEQTEVLKAQLVASLGNQNLIMYGVEGVREVTASVMAGFSFVATGNLAAPLAGSLLVQALFSTYQRISLARTKKKRKEMLQNMKQRSEKIQAAMAAALTAKKAAAATETVEAPPPAAAGEGSSAAAEIVTAADSSSTSTGAASSSSDVVSDSSNNENVDFLTLVLEAAAKQEEEQKRQQQQQQHSRSTPVSGTSSSSSSSTAEQSNTVAAFGAQKISSSSGSSNGASSSENNSSSSSMDADATAVAAAEAARQQLSVLLEDMLRSPEGFRVVQKWMDGQSISSTNGSSHNSSSIDKDPQKAVDQLLADPETKAKLLQELEDQLFAVSEQQQQRKKQEETWRQ